MYRTFIAAGIINVLYSTDDSADKRNVQFPKLFRIDVDTLDDVALLLVLHAKTNWTVVTNKCCRRSIGISCSSKCHVGSDCCQNLFG